MNSFICSQKSPPVIIVIEGIDQAGKYTQSRMLHNALADQGRRVALFRFPDYGTPSGSRIKDMLGDDRSKPEDLHTLLAENRLEKLDAINGHNKSGTIIVIDRYTPSNIAYGLANGVSRKTLDDLDKSMPDPDLVILLDISAETSYDRKGTDRDKFEKNLKFVGRVRDVYKRLAKEAGWPVVSADRKPDDIHKEILRIVEPRILELKRSS